MKKIKFALAIGALSLSAAASAMPPQVPDSYYSRYWGNLYPTLSGHRPCVGPAAMWCLD